MPIDKAKIEDARDAAAQRGRWRTLMSGEGAELVEALLAEREEMLSRLYEADKVLAWYLAREHTSTPAAGAWRLRYAAFLGRSSPERHYETTRHGPAAWDDLLSVLREVNAWLCGDRRSDYCPVCKTYAHAPDCRLASLLR